MSDAEAQYREGLRHQDEGRHAEAEASYRRSLALDPRQPKAHNNLGCVLQMQGRLDEAVTSFQRALALDPALAQANQNLAAITRDSAAARNALAAYRRHLEANPSDAEAHNNLGNVYRELGMHGEAIASFGEAIRIAPDNASARFSRAEALLLRGEYVEGWREYEWRTRVKGLGTPPREFAQPLWNGKDLAGTLLLHAEQGLGDTVQFARYARLAAERCQAVLLECQPQLAELLRAVPGISRVIPKGEPLPRFDAHLPLLSLPGIFGTTPETIPWNGPYLRADAERRERWRRELGPARLHVGLAWAGRPQQWDDRKRSMELATLAPLSAGGEVSFHSLQWGESAAQAAGPGMTVARYGDSIRDFQDLAALIAAVDVVVTVDTSVAHLAGALGAQTWVLLASAPDWRWLLGRNDTPWYPGMRLFRQHADGDWSGVVSEVAQALRELVRRSESPASP
jgi:Tfp pilus assembly protein PilF